jgi:hypothetical protein
MKIDIDKLIGFLIRAKCQTYAGDGKEITPQRPGFKELEYKEGDWEYRDSYSGFYSAPGQEVVRFGGQPIWTMAYGGGMNSEYHGNMAFAKRTFAFLKKALSMIEKSKPFRGPGNFREGDYEYRNSSEGDIKNFKGTEHIFYKGKEVFRQDYIGGLILSK